MQGELSSKWCRENLCETSAERELCTTRKGTFLVWRGRSLVDLYLSFVDSDGNVHHLPIKQLGKVYYLESQKFYSLPELVVYHLTLREFNNNPVKIHASQKRERLEATHIALTDVFDVPCEQLFNVTRGDLLAEVGRLDDRWLLAKHLPSLNIAFFDLKHTSVLSDLGVRPDALPYFHSQPQETLVRYLAQGGRGSFLVRPSRQKDSFTLLVHTGKTIEKFLLQCQEQGYRLSGKLFPSIAHLVYRYSIRSISSECCLVHAVLSDSCSPCSSTTSGVPSSLSSLTAMEDVVSGESNERERVIIASVTVHSKSGEEKEWKKCHLKLFEERGRAILDMSYPSGGPRNVLVLSHTSLFTLHESLLGRDACVYLSPFQSEPGIFLLFHPIHFYFHWFHLLRRYTVHDRSGVSSSLTMSYFSPNDSLSLLLLHVDKYKGENVKTENVYRMVVSVNGVAVASTPSHSPVSSSCVVFDSHFLLIVTSTLCEVQLSLGMGGVKGVNCSSRFTALSSSFQIHPSQQPLQSTQTFLFTAMRIPVTLLSMEAYGPLVQSLPDILSLCEWSYGRLGPILRGWLCNVVVSIGFPLHLPCILNETLGRRVDESQGENLLRQDSFSSGIVSASLRLTGREWLENKLEEMKTSNKDNGEEVLVGIVECLAAQPHVSYVLHSLSSTVSSRLPTQGNEHVVRRAISAAFLLRFVNPIVMSVFPGEGPYMAKALQLSSNTASSPLLPSDASPSASRLFNLFESIRTGKMDNTPPPKDMEAVEEESSILCTLLSLSVHPPSFPIPSSPSSPLSNTSPPSHSQYISRLLQLHRIS